MKFSENWLREFCNPDIASEELVHQLTMAGLEVDSVAPVAATPDLVVVGEVIAVEPHPDADRLVVCRVSTGSDEHQVVCGAPNAKPGLKAPFAQIGAQLPDMKVGKAKLRGVESQGMLCSEKELLISDDHEGLMELPSDAPVGENLVSYLQLNDTIIDLDLTPNRSDCLSLVGLAREVGVLCGLDLHGLDVEPVPAVIDDTFPVASKDASACPRFVGRVLRGI
ncbi:MAG: YtpR family tRNA-binding protein, partial [Pseudomonadales bacterium]